MNFDITNAARFCHKTDCFFTENGIERKSLNTSKKTATSFYQLGSALYKNTDNKLLLDSYCTYFFKVSQAQFFHFPENIYWDTDYLFFSAYFEIEKAKKQEEYLKEYMELLIDLLVLFGKHSNIKFRYLHDFTYGFDWAKWVKKNIKNRRVGPFALPFIQRMYKRGKELEKLIIQNDIKYHQLEKTQKFRNPFLFLREPAEEIKLLEHLYKIDFIPVRCWRSDGKPNWNKSFDAERNKISKELQILK